MSGEAIERNDEGTLIALWDVACDVLMGGVCKPRVLDWIDRQVADPVALQVWLTHLEGRQHLASDDRLERARVAGEADIRRTEPWQRVLRHGFRRSALQTCKGERPELLKHLASILQNPDLLSELEHTVFSQDRLSVPWAEIQACLGPERGIEVCLFDVARGTRHRLWHVSTADPEKPAACLDLNEDMIHVRLRNLGRFKHRYVDAALFELGPAWDPYSGLGSPPPDGCRIELVSFESWRERREDALCVMEHPQPMIDSEGRCDLRLPIPSRSPLAGKVLVVALTTKGGPAESRTLDRPTSNKNGRRG